MAQPVFESSNFKRVALPLKGAAQVFETPIAIRHERAFAENEFGSSYVQVVTWSKKPCPEAATILTYSLSSNPESPFAGDQTAMFSKKQWLTERFCTRDVLAHTLSTTTIRGR